MDNDNLKPTKFNFHKVFAAIGVILTVLLLIIAGFWIYLQSQGGTVGDDENENTVKVSTRSAPKATESATQSAE